LDNQLGLKHQKGAQKSFFTIQQTIRIIRDAFTSATERDIYTGDYLEVFIITKDKVTVEKYDLKKD
jgi:20S proteasome subunit beta 6